MNYVSVVCKQVSEKDQLADFAASLHSKLRFFDELEAVGGRFHGSAAPSVDSDAFLPLLSRLDDSLAFVAAHPQCVNDSNPPVLKLHA